MLSSRDYRWLRHPSSIESFVATPYTMFTKTATASRACYFRLIF